MVTCWDAQAKRQRGKAARASNAATRVARRVRLVAPLGSCRSIRVAAGNGNRRALRGHRRGSAVPSRLAPRTRQHRRYHPRAAGARRRASRPLLQRARRAAPEARLWQALSGLRRRRTEGLELSGQRAHGLLQPGDALRASGPRCAHVSARLAPARLSDCRLSGVRMPSCPRPMASSMSATGTPAF